MPTSYQTRTVRFMAQDTFDADLIFGAQAILVVAKRSESTVVMQPCMPFLSAKMEFRCKLADA